MKKILLLPVIVLMLAGLQSTAEAFTSSELVEVIIPSTVLTVQGRASPNSLVTVKEGGSVISAATADSVGNFKTSATTTSGIHEVTVYYSDLTLLTSKQNQQSISVQPQQENIHSVFLSPTIIRSTPSPVQNGSIVQIRGNTVPGAQVELSVDFGSKTFTTTSNSVGAYEFLLDSNVLGDGNHTASVMAMISGDVSDTSKPVTFLVQHVSGPLSPDIVVRPDQLPPPIPQSPEDGAIIDGDSVVVSGESVPNAQINIFENGIFVGSIFSDDTGKWSFLYQATSTPVVLNFEACLNGSCSVLSTSITLNFSNFRRCSTDFTLEKYRFWGEAIGDEIPLKVLFSTGNGVLHVDWGDGVVEEFNHDSLRPRDIVKRYNQIGQYNGTARFVQDDCESVRYFSVHITSQASGVDFWRLIWLFTIVTLIYIINQLATKKSSNK